MRLQMPTGQAQKPLLRMELMAKHQPHKQTRRKPPDQKTLLQKPPRRSPWKVGLTLQVRTHLPLRRVSPRTAHLVLQMEPQRSIMLLSEMMCKKLLQAVQARKALKDGGALVHF